METSRNGHKILTFYEKIKWKMEAQGIFLNHFIVCHHANGRLCFVRLLTKKQLEVIRFSNFTIHIAGVDKTIQ
jgi:histidinol phosphatase-like enzyme